MKKKEGLFDARGALDRELHSRDASLDMQPGKDTSIEGVAVCERIDWVPYCDFACTDSIWEGRIRMCWNGFVDIVRLGNSTRPLRINITRVPSSICFRLHSHIILYFAGFAGKALALLLFVVAHLTALIWPY